jgi:hypothetical protein
LRAKARSVARPMPEPDGAVPLSAQAAIRSARVSRSLGLAAESYPQAAVTCGFVG